MTCAKAKIFSFIQHCTKFQGKENTTATEAYKTERAKDIFGNAWLLITNARLFACAYQNSHIARANIVK